MTKKEQTIRRTISISPHLDVRIGELCSLCKRNDMDLDYTAALNLLVELGDRWLEKSKMADREAERDIWSRYLDFEKFERSVISDWKEYEEFRNWKLKAKQKKSEV